MKKILIMAKALGGGGAEVALIELLNKLDYNKYEIKLLLLDTDEEYKYRLKKNIDIEYIKFDSNFLKRLVSGYSFTSKVLKKLSINKYISYYDFIMNHLTNNFNQIYDIAIDFYGYGYFLTAVLAKKVHAQKKYSWVHDEKLGWFESVYKYHNEIDKFYGVSESVCKVLTNKYPDLKNKVEVFYNVVDIEGIKKKSSEFIPDEMTSEFNILTVGRLHEQKGYDIAIKAAALLKSKGIAFTWYAIGSGRDEAKLKKLIATYRLENTFVLLGRKDNPYPYMKMCDLYVQPSRHEGYGLTVLEAKVLHKPIIVSNLQVFLEQISDDCNGVVADLNPTALATKIEWLYKNSEARERYVEKLKEENIDFSKEIEKLYS